MRNGSVLRSGALIPGVAVAATLAVAASAAILLLGWPRTTTAPESPDAAAELLTQGPDLSAPLATGAFGDVLAALAFFVLVAAQVVALIAVQRRYPEGRRYGQPGRPPDRR